MKIFGLEIKRISKRAEPIKPQPCQHVNTRAGDLSAGIYHCLDCGKACVYIDGKLTALTFDNMESNDKGTTRNGIYQF